MTKSISIFSFLLFLTLTGTTCKNSPTEPEKPVEPDTTSQNFTFETKEFGDGFSSSYFNDVWVFSENNIWAVGYISQNQFQGNCNIMRWNGTEWKFLKTEGISSSSGIYGMWAIDSTEIYFANGSVSRFKKGAYTNMFINGTFSQGQSVHKLWGSSENNIWGVGPWGTVVHYDGVSWKKIEIDTNWYFFEISGNKLNGTAYATARNSDDYGIFKLEGSTATLVYSNSGFFGYSDLDFTNGGIMYSAWTSIYKTEFSKSNTPKVLQVMDSGIGLYTMSLASENDQYYYGKNASTEYLFHFNGMRWKKIEVMGERLQFIKSIKAIKNMAVVVANSYNDKATIKIIRRN